MPQTLSVAETKRRFSQLIERVERGERIVVSRRGKPVLALVAPEPVLDRNRQRPLGLAALAGALAEWKDLETVVEEIYRTRLDDE